MKKSSLLIIGIFAALVSFAQETRDKVMDKRAREMHRVLGLDDREAWKKFIRENYTQALIDKPMRVAVETNDNGSQTSTASTQVNNLEIKTNMYSQLHDEFGKSKIISISNVKDNLEMVLENQNGLRAIFSLKFESNTPFLLDGIGIEVAEDIH
jgi:hypothetical protein